MLWPCWSEGENVESHKYFKGVPQSRGESEILLFLMCFCPNVLYAHTALRVSVFVCMSGQPV